MKKHYLISLLLLSLPLCTFATNSKKSNSYVLPYNYTQVFQQSRATVKSWIKPLDGIRTQMLDPHTLNNEMVQQIAGYLLNRPYMAVGATGEGDWVPGANTYFGGALHIQQDPVYRIDGFNCVTSVSMVLALLHSNTLASFDTNMLHINYGAAGLPANQVYYYNRNNFVSKDFNPINQKNHFLADATRVGILKKLAKQTTATITAANWFATQAQSPNTIRLINSKNKAAAEKALQKTVALAKKNLPNKAVSIDYIPKADLVLAERNKQGTIIAYQANPSVLNAIQTPAVIEIVRDDAAWNIGGKNISTLIGSGINVSHLGIAYKETFSQGQVMANFTQCSMVKGKKVCTIIPQRCQQKFCRKLMYMQATDLYPNGYRWYTQHGKSYCRASAPKGVSSLSCNRIISMPLVDYFTQYEYGHYVFMDSPSILGIHIEKIL